MAKKEPIANRSKKQISKILHDQFRIDLLAFTCCFLLPLVLIICIAASRKLSDVLFCVCIIVLLAIPIVIRVIKTLILRKKLYSNQTISVTLDNPKADICANKRGDVIWYLSNIKICGTINGKKVTFREYHLKGPDSAYVRKAEIISEKTTYHIRVVEGTNVIDNFYEEKEKIKVPKGKINKTSYNDFFSNKSKVFKYEPILVKEEDVLLFFKSFSLYDELYFLNESNQYVLVKMTEDSKKYYSVGKKEFDNSTQTMEWLSTNGFIVNSELKLLAVFDLNDPNLFYKQLEDFKE